MVWSSQSIIGIACSPVCWSASRPGLAQVPTGDPGEPKRGGAISRRDPSGSATPRTTWLDSCSRDRSLHQSIPNNQKTCFCRPMLACITPSPLSDQRSATGLLLTDGLADFMCDCRRAITLGVRDYADSGNLARFPTARIYALFWSSYQQTHQRSSNAADNMNNPI